MSEPLATQTENFDVPAPPQDTIRSLDAPTPAAPEPEQEAPEVPLGPSWTDRNADYQRRASAQRRIHGRQARQLEEMQRRYEEGTERSNELMRQVLAMAQGRTVQQQQEAIPDPLSPEFGPWLQAQIAKGNAEQMKPVLEAFKAQQQALQQQQEGRQREELAAAQSREEAEWLQTQAYEYESEAPEISYGHEDRFHTVRDGIVTPAFQSMGHTPEESAQLANSLYRLIARGEAQSGRNPIAAIDAFNSSLVMAITERLGMPMVPVSGGGGGYAPQQPAYQPQQVVDPQQAEIQRQEAVRRRTSAAGSAAPRMAARGGQPKSEVAQLFAAGVHQQPGGFARIQAAAMREAGGNGQQAAILMQRYGG
jgi:hypothetical protein